MNVNDDTTSLGILGARFSDVARLLNSASPSDRKNGWDTAFPAYQKRIDRAIRSLLKPTSPESSATKPGSKTLAPGESASDISSKIYLKGLATFSSQDCGVSFTTESGLKKYIDRMVETAVADSARALMKSRKAQSSYDNEPLARSGDRPSKYDSGDYWNAFWCEFDQLFGEDIRRVFQRWLEEWVKETDFYRVWVVLHDRTSFELLVQKSPAALSQIIRRTLEKLRQNRALLERFQIVPPAEGSSQNPAPAESQ